MYTTTINFKKISIITILLTSFAIVVGRINFLVFENSFAHNFSPDESVDFLTIVDKINVEAQLAANSTGNNNHQSSTQLHANNAILNYDSHTKSEISEKNKRIVNELDDILNQLLVEVKSHLKRINHNLIIINKLFFNYFKVLSANKIHLSFTFL